MTPTTETLIDILIETYAASARLTRIHALARQLLAAANRNKSRKYRAHAMRLYNHVRRERAANLSRRNDVLQLLTHSA